MGNDYQILIFQYEPIILFSDVKQRTFTLKNSHAISKLLKWTVDLYHQVCND